MHDIELYLNWFPIFVEYGQQTLPCNTHAQTQHCNTYKICTN